MPVWCSSFWWMGKPMRRSVIYTPWNTSWEPVHCPQTDHQLGLLHHSVAIFYSVLPTAAEFTVCEQCLWSGSVYGDTTRQRNINVLRFPFANTSSGKCCMSSDKTFGSVLSIVTRGEFLVQFIVQSWKRHLFPWQYMTFWIIGPLWGSCRFWIMHLREDLLRACVVRSDLAQRVFFWRFNVRALTGFSNACQFCVKN